MCVEEKGKPWTKGVHIQPRVEGRLYRVSEDGTAETILETSETHLTALAVAPNRTVFAGSSPGGIVYRVAPAGEVFVLIDSDFRELKALALGPDGSLYAGGSTNDGGNIYTIDTTTAAATLLGPSGFLPVSGLTLVGEPAAVPFLTGWGLILGGLLIAGALTFVVFRYRSTHAAP